MSTIYSTKSKNENSILHYTVDEEKGVPYCGVHVLENGDYFCTVYGALAFGRSDHDRIIRDKKPTGQNITAERFYSKK